MLEAQIKSACKQSRRWIKCYEYLKAVAYINLATICTLNIIAPYRTYLINGILYGVRTQDDYRRLNSFLIKGERF
jgi:hypothetical protein